MPKITEQEMFENLDFVCQRCQAECTKINAAEPELGYISKVDGSFVGPLCSNCWEQVPMHERQINKVPETAFLVVVKQGGEGAQITTENIPVLFLRDPTSHDVINACNQVVNDINEAILSQKLLARLNAMLATNQKQPRIVVPN